MAQHWGRRGAHLSENKGVKIECKKFGDNVRQMASVSTICDGDCSSFKLDYTTLLVSEIILELPLYILTSKGELSSLKRC